MSLYVDAGGYSWTMCAKLKYISAKKIWEDVALLANQGAVFCIDSHLSIRKQHLKWYKAQRVDLGPATENLRACAFEFTKKLMKQYPTQCISFQGLEADDLIACAEEPGDIIMSADKDMLTLGKHTWLMDFSMSTWGADRIKTKLPIAKGNRWVTYQLMYGDTADNIDRLLLSRDIYTAKVVMAQPNPLLTAIGMLPPDLVRDQLRAIMLPTPLHSWPRRDPIDVALETYEV